MPRAHWIALALLVLRALTLADSAAREPVNYDESEYVYGGLRILQAGDWSVGPHPPLGRLLGGAGAYLAGGRLVNHDADYERMRREEPGRCWRTAWPQARELFSRSPVAPGRLLLGARLPFLLVFVGLGWVVYRWSCELHGPGGAAISLGLFLGCSQMAVMARIVSSGFAGVLAAVLALRGLTRVWGAPRWRDALACGALAGLAVGARHQLALVAVCLLALSLWASRRGARAGDGELAPARVPLGRALGLAGLAVAAAALVLLALYAVVWLPHFWQGVLTLRRAYFGDLGYDTYVLAGQTSERGWWWYFPLVVALKQSPALLLALAAALASLAWRRPRAAEWALLLPVGLTLALAMASGINYAIRHLLLIWPLLYVLAGRLGAGRWRWPLLALAALAAVDVGRVHPHYRGYLTPLVGGPAQAYRWVPDNATDGGQALGALRAELAAEGDAEVYLCYHGQADPTAPPLRIRYRALPMRWDSQLGVLETGRERFPQTLAISAFYLHTANDGVYRWLLDYEPISRPGYAIVRYDRRPHPEMLGLIALGFVHGALVEQRAPSLHHRYLARGAEHLRELRRLDPDGAAWARAEPWIRDFCARHPRTRLAMALSLLDAGWRDPARRWLEAIMADATLDPTTRAAAAEALAR